MGPCLFFVKYLDYSGLSGEEACERKGFDQSQCKGVGCCTWQTGQVLDVLRHVTVLKMIIILCAVLVSSWKEALWRSERPTEHQPTKHQPNHFVFSSDYWTNRWLPFTMLRF